MGQLLLNLFPIPFSEAGPRIWVLNKLPWNYVTETSPQMRVRAWGCFQLASSQIKKKGPETDCVSMKYVSELNKQPFSLR